MAITIKSQSEINKMIKAGQIVALCHQQIKKIISPGVTTQEIDQIVEKTILENGATPAFKNYQGFPSSVCASVNDVIVHGIPNNIPLKTGDIVTIDIGANFEGYLADSAWTYPVGKINQDDSHLLKYTELALYEALKIIKPGINLNSISEKIAAVATQNNLSPVPQYTGHGIGTSLHEDPIIPNVSYSPNQNISLKPGMTFAIEPIFNFGSEDAITSHDGWTVKTKDGSKSAHFEHTIIITDNGYQITTKLEENN